MSHYDFRMLWPPPPPLQGGSKDIRLFICHYDFRIGCDPSFPTVWFQKYKEAHLRLWFQNVVWPPSPTGWLKQGSSSQTKISECGVTPLLEQSGSRNAAKFVPPNNNTNNHKGSLHDLSAFGNNAIAMATVVMYKFPYRYIQKGKNRERSSIVQSDNEEKV